MRTGPGHRRALEPHCATRASVLSACRGRQQAARSDSEYALPCHRLSSHCHCCLQPHNRPGCRRGTGRVTFEKPSATTGIPERNAWAVPASPAGSQEMSSQCGSAGAASYWPSRRRAPLAVSARRTSPAASNCTVISCAHTCCTLQKASHGPAQSTCEQACMPLLQRSIPSARGAPSLPCAWLAKLQRDLAGVPVATCKQTFTSHFLICQLHDPTRH